jgi:DNA polymerase elongation subunit (family B)
MKIVHEKTAKHLIMYSAKCYALDKYESIKDKGKLEVKGLSFSKRDCCKFVGNTLKQALELVLRQGDLEGAKAYVRQRFRDLIDGKIPVEELAIYQKLSKSTYDEGQKVAHALLAKKIDDRNPGLGPKSGESVKVKIIYYNVLTKISSICMLTSINFTIKLKRSWSLKS